MNRQMENPAIREAAFSKAVRDGRLYDAQMLYFHPDPRRIAELNRAELIARDRADRVPREGRDL